MYQLVSQATQNLVKKAWLSSCAAALATIVVSGDAQAVPTRNEVYRNDDLGVIVYRDSEDSSVFWYLPMVRLYQVDGATQYRRRVNAEGNVQYTFYVVPEFPESLARFISNEIPGLHSRSQLKPVYAKKFAVQVRHFNLLAESEEVTDYRYLNQPQMIRLTLTADQAADFDDLFTMQPGVPANIVLYYESERVSKYLSIELTYREVYEALNIAATGRYTFTKGEIEASVGSYLSSKYLNIRRKGDIQIPEIVNRVVAECFTPVSRPPASGGSRTGGARNRFDLPICDGRELGSDCRVPDASELKEIFKELEQSLQRSSDGGVGIGKAPLNSSSRGGEFFGILDNEAELPPRPVPPRPVTPIGGTSPIGTPPPGTRPPGAPGTTPPPGTAPAGDASLQFAFKAELANRDERFVYLEQEMLDTQEIAVLPAFLVQNPGARNLPQVSPLNQRTALVRSEATERRPYNAHVRVEQGTQFVLSAAFTFMARSPHGSGQITEYRWEAEWGNPTDFLFFRVGNGPWQKLNGRTTISAGALQEGDIEFYIDRSSLWKKIPEGLRRRAFGGMVAELFPYAQFYPEFHVRISGFRVSSR